MLYSPNFPQSPEAQQGVLIYVKAEKRKKAYVRMKILLADDNPEVRSALRLLLEQEPLPAMVTEVSNMHSLFAHLKENCPRVVLLDWELPGLNGSSLLEVMRSQCPGMKVIALSSRYEARRDALTAGVDAFVSKAEPPEQILSILYTLLLCMKNN